MATSQLSDIYRFQAVTANLGTAGQPTAEQFDAVKDAGYEVVINLALGTTPRDLPNEPGIVAAHGIDYAHIPVVFDAPTDNDLSQFFAAMEANQHKKCFVHLSLSRFAAGTHAGAAHGVPGAPPASAADRPVHNSIKRCRSVKDRRRLWQVGVRDRVRDLCCALHYARFVCPRGSR